MISKLVDSQVNKWEDHLGAALWAYRSTISTITGFTPFFLHHGRQARYIGKMEHKIPAGQELKALAERAKEAEGALQ